MSNNLGQTFAPLLISNPSSTDTSTHLASDSGSPYAIKDLGENKSVRGPIPIQKGQSGGMMDSQETAIAMPRQAYAGTSGKGAGTTLLYSNGPQHIDFRRDEEG